MRILTVDDARSIREYIRNAVDVLGHELLEAEDGREGLRVLEREKGNVDLVLLDWNMPEMNGMEMLETMKCDNRFKHIPVTMVTTETERHRVVEAVGAGAKNYLMKPFTQEELAAKIMETFGMV